MSDLLPEALALAIGDEVPLMRAYDEMQWQGWDE